MIKENQKIESSNFNDLKVQLEALKAQFDLKLKIGELRAKTKNEKSNQDIEIKFPRTIDNLKDYIFDHYELGGILRERQATVTEDLLKFLLDGKTHGKIILPTGVGKTILFVEIVKALKLPTLIVLPTKIILNQTGDKIDKFNPELDYGKVYAKAKEYGSQITITTYDSYVAGVKTGRFKPENYKLMIMDEAHESLTKLRLEAKDKFLDNTIVLELTATEAYSETKKLTSETIHEMSIVEAVEEGLLAPLSCIIAKTDLDLSNVQINRNGEYNVEQLEAELEKAGMIKACVQLYKEGFMGQTGIGFVNSVKRAKELRDEFNNEFGIGYAEMLVGETLDEENERILKGLNDGSIKIVTGVSMITRGFDLPVASVCFNVDPTQSIVNAAQKGGRVTRLDENNPNKHAYVVDFLYSDKRNKGKQVLYPIIVGQSFVLPSMKQPKTDNIETQLEIKNREERERLLSTINIQGIKVIVNQDEVMKIVFKCEDFEDLNLYSKYKIIAREAGFKSSRDYNRDCGKVGLPKINILKSIPGWQDWDAFFDREILTFNDIRNKAIASGMETSVNYKNKATKLGLPSINVLTKYPEFKNWDEFFSRKEISFLQVKEKVKHNEITSQNQYQKSSKELGLPCIEVLTKFPEWTTWEDFFEIKKLSFLEIKRRVKEAGISSYNEYGGRYKSLKLCSASTLKRLEGFTTWDAFFDKEVLNFEQIKEKVRTLGVKSIREYDRKANDLGLPSSKLVAKMPEFNDWESFLNSKFRKSYSFEEVKQKAQRYGIKSTSEYNSRSRDLELPASVTLKNNPEFVSWDDFFGR